MGALSLPLRHLLTSIIILTSIVILPASAQCQEILGNLRFLLIAPDARGNSMANGGSVFSKGAISAYYNPALLATSEDFSAEVNEYKQDLCDAFMMNIYFSRKFKDWAYVGIGYTSYDHEICRGYGWLGWDDIRDYSLGLWAAFSVDPDNSYGIGIKYLKTHLDSDLFYRDRPRSSTIAFDFGWLSRNHIPKATWQNDDIFYPDLHRLFKVDRDKGFTLGISLSNLGKSYKFDESYNSYPLPKLMRLAVGYQAVDSEPVGLRLTIDATKLLIDIDDSFKEEWSEVAWSYGLESQFYYILYFRFGRLLDRGDHQRYNTIGFGIGPEWLRLDYSRVLGDYDHWNRSAKEYSISVNCNISREILGRF
jgi:hypothetical protein